jgi:antitoxin ParD1/3/4
MNISLTPQLEAMIREKVESGLYNNSSEVVREALRLIEQRDKEELLRAATAAGIAAADRGDAVEWSPQRVSQIWQDAMQAAATGEKPNPEVCP